MTGHTNSVWSVSFNPNTNVLASGSAYNTIKLNETDQFMHDQGIIEYLRLFSAFPLSEPFNLNKLNVSSLKHLVPDYKNCIP